MSSEDQQATRPAGQPAWISYVVPMALFMLMTALEGYRPGYYVWIYIAKVLVVSASLVVFRTTWKDYSVEWRVLMPAILVGLFVFWTWIPIDHMTPYHLSGGKRTGLDPFTAMHDSSVRTLFLAFRFFGLAVMVPFMEELFWRSFLLRTLSAPDTDFRVLSQGKFTWGAFGLVVAGFAFAHPEWLSAIVCAVAYGLLLWRTRNLFSCFVAHAVTNLALGLYIIVQAPHQPVLWTYW